MKLGQHGRILVSLVTEYVEGEIERWDFDLDYSGYVIEHFPAFQAETPRLSTRFANTIDRTYSYGAALSDDSFRESMAYALDEFCSASNLSIYRKVTFPVQDIPVVWIECL